MDNRPEGNSMRIIVSIRSLLFTLGMLIMSMASFAQVRVGVAITIAPPELPVYEQPICPGDGYLWAPGYWAYGDDGYFWVPGTWVLAPEVGFLWTPGYWGWGDGLYVWYPGYWGPTVGFYGGIDYGFGYTGAGFWGGYWNHDRFYYNRSVTNVNITNIQNVYSRPVENKVGVTRASFNGGPGGISRQATSAELAAARGAHQPPTSAQMAHERAARTDRSQWASVNHGRPAVAATARPAAFSGRGVVAASNRPTFHAPAHAAQTAGHGPAGTRVAARTPNRGSRPGAPLTAS